MKAFITRDSVAAGDDMDAPHTRTITVAATKASDDTAALIAAILRAYPLPGIAGGEATWCLSSAVPLAVVAQQWAKPRTLECTLSDCDVRNNVVRLHFSYLAQLDPTIAFEVISRLRLRARE